MNVLIIVDKIPSAIYTMALALEKNIPNVNTKILPVHPKRPDTDTLYEAQKLMNWADLINVFYWKSGEVLRTTFPVEFENSKRILFHHNPYDVDKMKWFDHYPVVGCFNSTIQLNVAGSHLIPYGIDLEKWTYNEEYTDDKTVQMTVGRIESNKGILEVAQACRDLGYRLLLVGRVSEPDYMKEIMGTGAVEFMENVTDEELKQAYYRSAVHVCNSRDNFESGTLPILEAMACGVPVLTREVGQIPDIYNGENMVVRKGAKEDLEDLKNNLKEMVENKPMRERIRQKGWETVKSKSDKIMARRIAKLYLKAVGGDKSWVSVIVPTFDRPDTLLKTLVAIENQTYQNIEIVVVDSGEISVEPLVREFRKNTSKPIVYERFANNGEYTLAKARNIGIQRAMGSVIVFNDDRLNMEKDAVEKFEQKVRLKTWLWGEKDGSEKGFVENFSCILREELVKRGMFNERINVYGGQTQEVRHRFEESGVAFEFVPEAKAKSIEKSSKAKKRNDIIKAKFLLQELYE